MNNWLNISHNWLLPRRCLLCSGNATRLDLCQRCIGCLPRISRACQGCGIPLTSGRWCAGCLSRPRLLDGVCIPYRYDPPVSSLILRLKFQRRVEAAVPLGRLLLDAVRVRAATPELILPVPLHGERLRQRGFNQALEIARPVARALNVPLAPRLAARQKHTVAQSGLGDAAARWRNLRGAFIVDLKRVAGLNHVAIVDDVVTTGATVTELASALKRTGVTRVDLWSVARATAP